MFTGFGITLCLWYNFNLCKLSNMKLLSKQKNKKKDYSEFGSIVDFFLLLEEIFINVVK